MTRAIYWSYLTCGSVLVVSYRVDEVCETPLSRRTTKCWSTQWGLACRQAREPQKKNLGVHLVFGILPVIGCHHIVIGSFPNMVHSPTCSSVFVENFYRLFTPL